MLVKRRCPTMARLRLLEIYLLVLLAITTLAGPPCVQEARGSSTGDVLFKASTASFYEGKPKSVLRVCYEVPYEQLNFVKSDTVYKATLDVKVVCYDRTGEQVGGDVWREELSAETYEETKASTRRFASCAELSILPGSYRVKIQLEDLSSHRSGSAEMDVLVRSFGASDLEVSDPVFLHFFSDTLFYPNPSRGYVRGFSRGAVTFDIYRLPPAESVQVEMSLSDSKGKIWNRAPVTVGSAAVETKTVVFSVDTLPQDTLYFVLTFHDSTLARWPFTVYEPFFMDAARFADRIESMRYIASDEELDKLRKAPPEEREAVYADFWKERDPVPSTEINEAEVEYFSRVEYADRNFGGLVDGWKTDRGRIYIQYGRPDEMEKHPFERDSAPYEIWYYYATGSRFLFVDEHNLGRYELKWWQGRQP
jgi:GWxTD domain-containing protein